MRERPRTLSRPMVVLAVVALAALLLAAPAPRWLGWSDGRTTGRPAPPATAPGDRARTGWFRTSVPASLPPGPGAVAAAPRPPTATTTTTTSTTTAPAPAIPPPPAPAPSAPPPDPASVDPGGDPGARVLAALQLSVPPAWRDALPLRVGLRGGSESRAYTDGLVEVALAHAEGPWDRLRAIVAHEVAHQVAFRFGTGAYLGAAPAGWVPAGPVPAERWADCAAEVLTGVPLASHGLPPCGGDQLRSAAEVLSAGPPAGSAGG